MHRYKLTLAYDGTAYHGWQIQPNALTIQAIIEEKLQLILQHPVRVIGSGRTDTGVHALEQVAHFDSDVNFSTKNIYSLNGMLPKDIRVLSLEVVDKSFHSQHSALSKIYHYHLFLDKSLNPFKRLYSWHLPFLKDIEAMKRASKYFIGTHDFTSFANEAHKGVAARDPVRTMMELNWVHNEGELIIQFEADGFLYRMVRNIVGFLVDCGLNKRSPEEALKILSGKDRKLSSSAAPPQGLFMVQVKYPHLTSSL